MRYTQTQVDQKIRIAELRVKRKFGVTQPIIIGICSFILGFCLGGVVMILRFSGT